jgi:MFS family permease
MPLARTYSDEDSNDGDGTTQETEHSEVGAGQFQENGNGYQGATQTGATTANGNGIPSHTARWSFVSVRHFISVASIEPLLLLFRLAMGMTDVTIQSFYLETVCHDEYKDHPEINCSNLTETEKKDLETLTTKFFTYREVLESAVPIFFIIAMGQYVDKHGSKFPMMYASLCSTVACTIYFILTFVSQLNPRGLLFASIPIAIGGTFVVFLFSSMKHIASNTSTESRSFRIAIAEIIWQIGSPVGLMVALPILKHFGYKPVFLIAAILYLLCVIYTILFVTNDKPQNELIPRDLVESDSFKCRSLFNLSNLTETFRCCFRKRSGLRRIWLMTLFAILFFRFLIFIGDYDIAYLYTYHKFSWTNSQFSVYQTTVGIFGIVGSILLSAVSFGMLPWSDPMIGLISGVSYTCGLIIVAAATHGFMMYIGAAFQMFSRLITIIVRSLSSKIVAKQEVGKVYSFLGVIESITPFLASLVFNFLFIQTKDNFTPAVYVLCSALASCLTFLYLYLFVSMRGQELHQEVEGHPAGVET